MPDRAADLPRTDLPIPDRPHTGLVTYDARDPDTAFPPIAPLRPPAVGAPHPPPAGRLEATDSRNVYGYPEYRNRWVLAPLRVPRTG